MKKTIKKLFGGVMISLSLLFGLALFYSSNGKVEADSTYPHETKEDGKWIREVTSWDDLDIAFENIQYDDNFEKACTIRLTTNLSMSAEGIANNALLMKRYTIPWNSKIMFDFNGHTIKGVDNISSTNTSYKLEDFIVFYMMGYGTLTFDDSVGGGGIDFYSSRATDGCNLAAVRIEGVGSGDIGEDFGENTVIFNGGTFKLTAQTAKISKGTLYRDVCYRGTVISDHVKTIINDGEFIAKSEGLVSSGTDFCARELSAFGTVVKTLVNYLNDDFTNSSGLSNLNTVINGGIFTSDGYAIHHFDNNWDLFEFDNGGFNYSYIPGLDTKYYIEYPTINGGIFKGQMGYTGETFVYSDGNPELNALAANMIIPNEANVYGILASGKKIYSVDDLNWKDLHDIKACMVVSDKAIDITTTPESGDEELTNLSRTVKDSDIFRIDNEKPYWLTMAGATFSKMISVTRKNSNQAPKNYYNKDVTINYSDYQNGLYVDCYLFITTADGEIFSLTKSFDIDVKKYYDIDFISNAFSIEKYAEDDEMVALEGTDFKFRLYAEDYYEIIDEANVIVQANDQILTKDDKGVYTISNVTENQLITVTGSGFKGYANFTYKPGKANGSDQKTKYYVGDKFTLKELEELGYTLDSGVEFSGYKIGNKLYQPGDEYTVTKVGEITAITQTKGVYAIEVINGKAYSDANHTIEITEAREDDMVYIVADEAPEGLRFDSWSYVMHVSSNFLYLVEEVTSAVNSFQVYAKSGVTLTANYVKDVTDVELIGVNSVIDGEEYKLDHDTYFTEVYISVPKDAKGYKYSTPAYMYDITGHDDDSVNTKAKIDALGLSSLGEGTVFVGGNTYLYRMTIKLVSSYEGEDVKYSFPTNLDDLDVVLNGLNSNDYEIIGKEFVNSYQDYVAIYVKFACEELNDHEVIVENGSGSGIYFPYDTVEIKADEAPEGYVFKEWSCEIDLDILLGDMTSEMMIFTMPNDDITISATYEIKTVYVSGKITSQGDEDDDITISLIKDGVLAYSTKVNGIITEYSISNVLPGVYTLLIQKYNHIKYEKEITVTNELDYKKDIVLVTICSEDSSLHEDEDHDFYCDICGEILLDYTEEDGLKTFTYDGPFFEDTDLTKLFKVVSNGEGDLLIFGEKSYLYFDSTAVKEIAENGDVSLYYSYRENVIEGVEIEIGLKFINFNLKEGIVFLNVVLDESLKENETLKVYYQASDDFITKDCNIDGNKVQINISEVDSSKVTNYYVDIIKNQEVEESSSSEAESSVEESSAVEESSSEIIESSSEASSEAEQSESQIAQSSTEESNDDSKDNGGIGGGAIAGIVIASIAVIGALGFALYWFVLRKKN